MNADKLRVGDFLTYCKGERPEVCRIVGFDHYDNNSGKMSGKVFSASVVFALSDGQVQVFERYYLEHSEFSTETEIKAWKHWAKRALKNLQRRCKFLQDGVKARRPKSRISPPVPTDEWRGFKRHWTYQFTH